LVEPRPHERSTKTHETTNDFLMEEEHYLEGMRGDERGVSGERQGVRGKE